MTTAQNGLLVAAPQSGSGKTVVTLALLRALSKRGIDVAAAKAGPDYIDPAFHALASHRASVNLDPWAMTSARLKALAGVQKGSHLLVEAMMGLFDGAADGSGSAADLASTLGLPVVLVVDAGKLSHSVAALARGFRDHRSGIDVAGVILNKVGSARHEAMLRDALGSIGMTVFGAVPRSAELVLPERHLGLVQAGEHSDMEAFIERASDIVGKAVDIDALLAAFTTVNIGGEADGLTPQGLRPLGQRIAIARDNAFSFLYPHMAEDWRRAGAAFSFFSPLADEAPEVNADAVYLPGGYPELHGGRLAGNARFLDGLRQAASRGALIYGECGGYMVLGEGLVDAEGQRHTMAGLLKLETSFAERRLHLGYRRLEAGQGFALGQRLTAHEFHYSIAQREEGEPLFYAHDALGEDLGMAGLRAGNVMGSYMHVIDRIEP
ncbi:MAG: cobyrinate a,c-diamide synthase [Salaquimonas sp.]|nr:cobyrinate a,c-diamide synthase [Salaquimonas sp.]